MTNICKTCEHYHYHTEKRPDNVENMTIDEYEKWMKSIPCRNCKYNYVDDNYSEALKRCPFCGGMARIVVDEDDYSNKDYCVECGDCAADTRWFKSKEEAIKTWNRRVERVCQMV